MSDLFRSEPECSFEPLASRLRPRSLSDYVGQAHLLAPGKALRRALEQGLLHSFILWGPPGTGKTSLAQLFADLNGINFIPISAVSGGMSDIRAAVQSAQKAMRMSNQRSLVFVDEVHRFNKAQQDGFLPFIENGTFSFIGATTENPSFHLNSALLSRARVYRLNPLSEEELGELLTKTLNALRDDNHLRMELAPDARRMLIDHSSGDARRLITMVEIVVQQTQAQRDKEENELVSCITQQDVRGILDENQKSFDKAGDHFYDQISALHKSVRGSDPDAALYWFCRMIQGGCDPLYLGRRLIRMASEDIGNADPRALQLCLNASESYERLGSPEGELVLAQAVIYLAVSAKSNAVYAAYKACMGFIKESPDFPVPMHIRNAPTQLMKDEGMGQGYRYAHDEPEAFAAGEVYLPESIKEMKFYNPVKRGLEIRIAEKLDRLAEMNRRSDTKRYPS